MFYVQHLLGTGHVRRIALIARAVAAQGIKVVVASGGFPVKNLDWGEARVWQLPPIRARDSEFSALVDENGNEIGGVFKETRRDQLLACFNETKPDVVVIETYPFGRRKLRFELTPLIEEILQRKSSPKLVCSVRDVLQLKNVRRRQETLQILNDYYDAVLAHGDASFIALGDSFSEANDIGCDVVYTGYVADEAESQVSRVGENEIIVAAGGGAAAGNLYRCTVEVSRVCEHLNKSWRLLVGAGIPEDEFKSLSDRQSKILKVERNRLDYPVLLRNAALSVSQAGYNTVLDVLQSGARALFIPFEGKGETEQVVRAKRLHELGYAGLLRESELSVQTFVRAVVESLDLPKPKNLAIDTDGINRSTEFILGQLTNF